MKFQLSGNRYILDGILTINGVRVYPIVTPTPPTEINPVYSWGAVY